MAYIDIAGAAEISSEASGVGVNVASIQVQCDLGILPKLVIDGKIAIRDSDARRLATAVLPFQSDDGLFADLATLFGVPSKPVSLTPGYRDSWTETFLKISPILALSFSSELIRPDLLQLFIPLLRQISLSCFGGASSVIPHRLTLANGISLWSAKSLDEGPVRMLWNKCLSERALPRDIDILTLPKMYGNKHRMTSFLAGIVRSYIEDGSELLDLMSGTGIVSSRLSPYFLISANDANPYASTLTSAQFSTYSAEKINESLAAVRENATENLQVLAAEFRDFLDREAEFLHGEPSETLLSEYRVFCEYFPRQSRRLSEIAAIRRQNPKSGFYCLALSHFSNAYFGVRQSMDIDSIRFGIEAIPDDRVRGFLLAALLIASCNCASTPHFAQPPKLSGIAALREIVEHRARDLFSEFLMTARFMHARTVETVGAPTIWTGDWRTALDCFSKKCRVISENRRAVYVDPPYTKLQFSRYYHVLNTLLRYDYPGTHGEGRYPPRESRFSSRFEYQPRSAEREFGELIHRCAERRLPTFISYSDKGMVPIPIIIAQMEREFPTVHLYCKEFRHNSQGTRFREGRQRVTEYVLAGIPS